MRCNQNFLDWLEDDITIVSTLPLLDGGIMQSAESFAINFKTAGCAIQK